MENSVLEVNLDNIKYNLDKIRKYANKEIMPVIKANGYGTYINEYLDFLDDFNIVAVAEVSEAVKLRELDYRKDIFVLNQPYIEDIEIIEKYDIIVGISSKEFINEVLEKKSKIRCHLEIETGMNRTGIKLEDLDNVCNLIADNSISVEGIYTHFSSADNDMEYTNKQIELFKEAIGIAYKYFDFKYIHMSASNGILNIKDDITNLVRVGIIMYGYPSSDNTYEKIKLKPACKLYSRINYIKEIEPGSSISYGKTFTSKKKMIIATVGIGYADGVRRCLSNKGYVVINNMKCPIVGNICMDSLMVDVSKCNVNVGDKVYIWENNLIKLEDISTICNTIDYEILCNIGNRVKRNYIKE